MKKLGLICCIWVFFVNYALGQQITAAEYFFDDDPGVGNATALTIAQGASIDETFSIPTTGLSEGLHVLHIRTQDSDNVWSLYLRRYFFVNNIESYEAPTQYEIVDAEYFIDDDPGVSNGTELAITNGNTINENFTIPTVGIAEGLHVLHIRTLDDNGTWSLYERRYFYIHTNTGYVNPPSYTITEIEYFFDTDPGMGNGTALAIAPGNTIDESFTIDTTGLSGGLHVLHIRAKDDNDTWSLYERRYFFIYTNDGYIEPTEFTITEAEYFFDNDLGVGNANALPVTSGNTVNELFSIDTSELEVGMHVLHIRAKDDNGTWSLYERKYFYAMQPYNGSTPVQMVEAEYFLDDDPGVGNGTSIPITPGITLDETLVISVECWEPDDYMLHIRIKDENGIWSHFMFDDFKVEEDLVPPTVITKDIIAELDASGNVTISVEDINDGSYDACGILSMSLDVMDFDCSNLGENTVTLTVTDNNNNIASETATVTVIDVTPPDVITQGITIQLDANGMATISDDKVDDGSSDACGPLDFDTDITDFDCSDLGTNTVTLTVTDGSGNSNEATAIVTVEDVTPPNLVTQNITVQLDASGTATILEDAVDNGSFDACGPLDFDTDITSFDCSDLGANTVTLTVTDSSGNSNEATAIVTVEDVTPPNLVTQNITVQLDASGTATILEDALDNGSSDACGPLDFDTDITDFDCSDLGTNTVTLTVTDDSGNSNEATAIVTVEDLTLPTIEAPADIFTVTATDNCEASIVLPDVELADNCESNLSWVMSGIVSDNGNGQIGTYIFPMGSTTITFTNTDTAGNTANDIMIVEVNDNVMPDIINLPTDINSNTDSGSCTATVSWVEPTADDNCSVASFNQVAGPSNGSSFAIGETLITYEAIDTSGNVTTESFSVTVNDTELPTISEIVDFSEALVDGCNFSIPDYTGLTSVSDNCGVASIVQVPSVGTVISGHSTTQEVILTVTDNSGNTNSTSFIITLIGTITYYADSDGDGYGDVNITIKDCELPTGYSDNALDCDDTNENIHPDAIEIACNGIDENCNGMEDDDNVIPVCLTTDITVQLDESTGQATITANDVDNGSYDNCGIDTMTVSPDIFDSSNLGENEVTLTITDVNGNVVTCQSSVTVEDTTLGVEDSEIDDISIYPNPFEDGIIIKLPASFNGSKFKIKLFDLRGRLVIDYQKQVINQQIVVSDLSQLEAAAYFIEISDMSTGNFIQRRLVKH